MNNHVTIIVTGRVQGVGYRVAAQIEADRLGIGGFAMNCEDGSVRIEAEGKQSCLDEFVAWCRVGPLGSHVDHINSTTGALQQYTAFEIRRLR